MPDIQKLFEDDHILVITKPSGLVVNRSETARAGTLQDFLDEQYSFQKGEDADAEEFVARSGIVHRLDKDTSGVLVVAKTPDDFSSMKQQFKARTIDKEYAAVVHGDLEDSHIEINAPIKRNPQNPLKFVVHTEGREAQTIIEKVRSWMRGETTFTLVKVIPKTGRTHQIRVHLAALRHPVAGDAVYSTKAQYDIAQRYYSRLMLHACKLTFNHPQSGERVTFESKLPSEFMLE